MHPLRWKGLIKKKLWKSKPIVDRSDFLKDEIIENEQIDYVHAQPDSEVQFISKNSSQINAKTLNIKEELIKKYGNKEFTNQKWSEKFGSFETYSYIDILENKIPDEKLFLK